MTEIPPPSAAPEMSRPFPIARIGDGARFTVEATQAECRALSIRMGLAEIYALTCRFDLRRGESHAIEADGLLHARIRQTCVVSLEPFDATIVENFTLRFVPEGRLSETLDIESDDEIAYEGNILELGEAASEQLALVIDPFPRMPGAELPGDAPLLASPFATLSKLLQ